MSSSSPSSKIFIGNPSLDEIKNFFLREKKLADIRFLERKIELEQKDTSPELSESFEIYLEVSIIADTDLNVKKLLFRKIRRKQKPRN